MNENYIIRSIEANEIELWCQFCSNSFSEKINPPNALYFYNHLIFDSNSDYSLIFIAIDKETNEFSSTLRLFKREIYSNGNIIPIIGIGEVCTSIKHRKKGLSKYLLNYSLNIIKSYGYNYSLLHANVWIRDFYSKFGFISHSIEWLSINITKDLFVSDFINKSLIIKQINLLDHIHEINDLYNKFSSQFNGPLVRSIEYTSKWINNESNSSLCFGLFDKQSNKLVSYIIYKEKNNDLIIVDFALTDSILNKSCSWNFIFNSIKLIYNYPISLKVLTKLAEYLSINISNDVITFFDTNISVPVSRSVDSGWMISDINNFGNSSDKVTYFDIYWPIDSF